MPINRLNHAVLYVGDAERSADFYEEVLGFRRVFEVPGAVFLQAEGSTNDHDLGLFSVGDTAGPSDAGRGTAGLYHLAWEVDTLDELDHLRERLEQKGALVGTSDHGSTKALYARDPDGIELEVCWLVPADLLDAEALDNRRRVRSLDLDRDRQRFGGTTVGGIGVSRPSVAPS